LICPKIKITRQTLFNATRAEGTVVARARVKAGCQKIIPMAGAALTSAVTNPSNQIKLPFIAPMSARTTMPSEKLAGVMKKQCASCPFREDGRGLPVRELLERRALSKATPICHSTGPGALVSKKKKLSAKPLACRGARDLQLRLFHAMGFIEAPTDIAWNKKAKELKL
jgi:hypothetical protein